MKENRIPIGKKKENIEKIVEQKKSKLYLFIANTKLYFVSLRGLLAAMRLRISDAAATSSQLGTT